MLFENLEFISNTEDREFKRAAILATSRVKAQLGGFFSLSGSRGELLSRRDLVSEQLEEIVKAACADEQCVDVERVSKFVNSDVEDGDTYWQEKVDLPSAGPNGINESEPSPKIDMASAGDENHTSLKPIDVPSNAHPTVQQNAQDAADYTATLDVPGPDRVDADTPMQPELNPGPSTDVFPNKSQTNPVTSAAWHEPVEDSGLEGTTGWEDYDLKNAEAERPDDEGHELDMMDEDAKQTLEIEQAILNAGNDPHTLRQVAEELYRAYPEKAPIINQIISEVEGGYAGGRRDHYDLSNENDLDHYAAVSRDIITPRRLQAFNEWDAVSKDPQQLAEEMWSTLETTSSGEGLTSGDVTRVVKQYIAQGYPEDEVYQAANQLVSEIWEEGHATGKNEYFGEPHLHPSDGYGASRDAFSAVKQTDMEHPNDCECDMCAAAKAAEERHSSTKTVGKWKIV